MKKILLMCLFITMILFSCKEVGPYINLTQQDTTFITYVSDTTETADAHIVLIEEFTGMSCPNCPYAAAEIHNLDSTYPRKIIPIAYHIIDNTPFSPTDPIAGRQDFRTVFGTNIYTMLTANGGSGSIPIGAVDRLQYTGESYLLCFYNSWPTHYNARSSVASPVNIHLTDTVINKVNDSVKVKLTLHYTSGIQSTNKNYLSVSLIEDSILDWQDLPGGIIDSNYYHNHILRTMFTDFDGLQLTAPLVTNRVFIKQFETWLNPKWNKSHCYIVAYIHRRESSTYEVLQTARIKMIK